MNKDDGIDFLLLALALASVAALARIVADACKPLPISSRFRVVVDRALHR